MLRRELQGQAGAISELAWHVVLHPAACRVRPRCEEPGQDPTAPLPRQQTQWKQRRRLTAKQRVTQAPQHKDRVHRKDLNTKETHGETTPDAHKKTEVNRRQKTQTEQQIVLCQNAGDVICSEDWIGYIWKYLIEKRVGYISCNIKTTVQIRQTLSKHYRTIVEQHQTCRRT